jgi:hypothetical protein
MPTPETCRHHTLARNGVAHVQRCAHCRCLSLHVGPVTVRLDEGSLEALRLALNEAREVLSREREADLTPATNTPGGVA